MKKLIAILCLCLSYGSVFADFKNGMHIQLHCPDRTYNGTVDTSRGEIGVLKLSDGYVISLYDALHYGTCYTVAKESEL